MEREKREREREEEEDGDVEIYFFLVPPRGCKKTFCWCLCRCLGSIWDDC